MRRASLALLAVLLFAVGSLPGASAAPAAKGPGQKAKPTPVGAPRISAKAPRIPAKAWILIDPRDGSVLAEHKADARRPIASATKLMTAHLALKNLDPKQKLSAVPYQALAVESVLGLRAGERMSVRDLLYALVLPSANDAAQTIARGVAGSEKQFVAEMNRGAQALGLTNTHFANPIGLDAAGNYSTARDLVTLAGLLLEDPLFARIADSSTATLKTGARPRRITSRNLLLNKAPFITGVKTGHTINAGWVLVGAGERSGTTLISAVLGAPNEAARDSDTVRLLDYGFSLYRPSTPVRRGEELADPKLDYRDERIDLVAAKALPVSARQDQRVETEIDAPDEVSGPVEKGDELGEIVVTVDGREAARTPLVAASSAPAATLLEKAVATAQEPVVLVPAGAFVIVLGLLLAGRSRRRDEEKVPAQRDNSNNGGRTPEERRKMHEERMAKRREQISGKKGSGQ